MRKYGHLLLVKGRRRQRPCRDVRFARPRTGHRPVPTSDYGFSHSLAQKGRFTQMLKRDGSAWKPSLCVNFSLSERIRQHSLEFAQGDDGDAEGRGLRELAPRLITR